MVLPAELPQDIPLLRGPKQVTQPRPIIEVNSYESAQMLGNDDVYEEMCSPGTWKQSVEQKANPKEDDNISAEAVTPPRPKYTDHVVSDSVEIGGHRMGRSPDILFVDDLLDEGASDVYVDMCLSTSSRPGSVGCISLPDSKGTSNSLERRSSAPVAETGDKAVDDSRSCRSASSAPSDSKISSASSKSSISPSPRADRRRLFSGRWRGKKQGAKLKGQQTQLSLDHELCSPESFGRDGETGSDVVDLNIRMSQSCLFEVVESSEPQDTKATSTSYVRSLVNYFTDPRKPSATGKHVYVRTHPGEFVTATALDLVQNATRASSVSVDDQRTPSPTRDTAYQRGRSSSNAKSEKRKKSSLRTGRGAGHPAEKFDAWNKSKSERRLSNVDCQLGEARLHHSYLQDAFFPERENWKEEEAESTTSSSGNSVPGSSKALL